MRKKSAAQLDREIAEVLGRRTHAYAMALPAYEMAKPVIHRHDKHYLTVTAECPATIVLRVPLPVPPRVDLMRALTPVMREHGCRQKHVRAIEDLVSRTWDSYSTESYFIERLDRAFGGAAWFLPKLWLYDWRSGALYLARRSTAPVNPQPTFFQTQEPLEEARLVEQHPTIRGLVSRRGVGEIAGCEPGVICRLENQGAIAPALVAAATGPDKCARPVWYRSTDAVKLRSFAAGSAESAKADSQRRAAAMWMLHIQGAPYNKIAQAFGLSLERVRQIVLKYQRQLDQRAVQAERWLQKQTAGRARAELPGTAREDA